MALLGKLFFCLRKLNFVEGGDVIASRVPKDPHPLYIFVIFMEFLVLSSLLAS